MGRGNACVFGDYEGLYYVDWDNFPCEFEDSDGNEFTDYDLQRDFIEESLNQFKDDFLSKFKSFRKSSGWTENNEQILMESSLFYIAMEDNEWSIAIKLLQKEQDYYSRGNIENLQKKHHNSYLEGMRDCLFNQFDTLRIYGGAWTSGTIKRSDFLQ